MAYDLNTILTLIIAIWSFALLLQARGRQHGWMAIAGLQLVVLAICLLFLPRHIAAISGSLWFISGVLPTLAARVGARAMAQERYLLAEVMYRIASLLHPFDGWPLQAQIARVIRQAARGNFGPTDELLSRVREASGQESLFATAQLLRFKRDDHGLIALYREHGLEEHPERQPVISSLVVRALAEHGQLAEAFSIYRTIRASLHASRISHAFLYSEITLAIYAGQPELVERLLDGYFVSMSNTSRRLYLLAARLNSGDEAARGELEQLLEEVRPRNAILAQRIAHDLDRSSRIEPPHLAAEHRQALDEMARRLDIQRRYGRGVARKGRPYATLVIIALIAVVFAVEALLSGPTDFNTLWSLGALHPDAVIDGAWWRIFASTFLHYGWLHVTFNLIALIAFGPFVEFSLGKARFVGCYILSGAGSMLTLVLAMRWGFMQRPGLVVGASGSIMGLVGATAAILLLGWHRERAPIAKRRLIVISSVIVLQMGLDYLIPQVSGLAHSSGAAIGFLVALAFTLVRKPSRKT